MDKKNTEEEEITKKKRENFNAVPHLLHKNKCDDACILVYTNCLWNLGLNENNVFMAFESQNKTKQKKKNYGEYIFADAMRRIIASA